MDRETNAGIVDIESSWPFTLGQAIVTLTSVPLIPREPWWTKLAKLPGRLWSMSSEIATLITDRAQRPPSKRKLAFIRLPVMAGLILLAPLLLPFAVRVKTQGTNLS